MHTGEQVEGFDRWEDWHFSAIERAASDGPRMLKKLSVQRAVNDVRDPQAGVEEAGGTGQSGRSRHACRSDMDQSVRNHDS
jgi:hypothetical protein